MKIKISNKITIFNPDKETKNWIKEQLTLTNPKWIENRRMGRWNGDTSKHLKFYEVKDKSYSVPIGFESIFPYLTQRKVKFQLYDNRYQEIVKFQFTGQLRDFQTEAMQSMLYYNFGTLQAPTGAGKTIMGIFAIAYRKQKTLVIVHSKDLMQQWIQSCCKFLNIKPVEIGTIGDGSFKIGRRLTIGIINSIYNNIDKLKKEFGHVVTDECHRCPSKTFIDALSMMNPLYRTSLSATAFRRDGLDNLIEWFGGTIRYIVEKEKLIEHGHILKPIFIIRETNYFPKNEKVLETYAGMLSDLCLDTNRNRQIVKDIAETHKDKSSYTLILSDRKEHCYLLRDWLSQKPYRINPLLLTGDVKNRQEVINKIKNRRILIATSQLIGEGFDCPFLNTLYLTTPLKYAGRIIQYIGRIMRPDENNKTPIVYDYADWNIDILARQVRSRIKVYGKENVRHE